MSARKLILPVLASLVAAAVWAEGPSEKDKQEYQKRLAAIQADLANAHQQIAAWCEKGGLLKQALHHWKEAQTLAPNLKDALAERIKKIEDDLAKNPPEPTEAAMKAYFAKLAEMAKEFQKRFEELSRWAAGHGLKDEAAQASGQSRAMDPDVLIAGEKGTTRLELASWQKDMGNQICTYRKVAGCPPVEVDLALSAGAGAHALYLFINEGSPKLAGLGVHQEEQGMPGYSEAGANAAANSDIGWGSSEQVVDGWMATLYHRIPILRPRLAKVGLGRKDGCKEGTVVVADLQSGIDSSKPAEPSVVLYPAPDQKDVPHAFGGETPSPLPAGEKGAAGYPITLMGTDENLAIKDVKVARLTGPDGTEVACHLSTPERPARADFPQSNTVCLIPKGALAAHARYTVEIQCTIGDAEVRKTWSFTTK